jgi:hypothetical protein
LAPGIDARVEEERIEPGVVQLAVDVHIARSRAARQNEGRKLLEQGDEVSYRVFSNLYVKVVGLIPLRRRGRVSAP